MSDKIAMGSFYLPDNFDYQVVEKQLLSIPFVKIKDIFSDNKNDKSMPLSRKVDFYLSRNNIKNSAKQLSDEHDNPVNSDDSLKDPLEKAKEIFFDILDLLPLSERICFSDQYCETFLKQLEVLKNQNDEVISIPKNDYATETNDLIPEKEVEKSVEESEGKESDNGKGKNVVAPSNTSNQIKCKVKISKDPHLESKKNDKEKKEKLPSSKYLLYLKKVSDKKISTKNLGNVEDNSTKNSDYDSRNKNENPCLRFLHEETTFDDREKSGGGLIKAKRGLDDLFSSCEISNKQAKLSLEDSEVGIPYEPVGKTLETSTCLSDEGDGSDIESQTGEPKPVEFELAANVPHISNSYKDERNKVFSLQEEFERVINNLSPSYKKEIFDLKSGLCSNWLQNNFFCSLPSLLCRSQHNARELFRQRLQEKSSSFIIELIIAMRNDLLFIDILMEGFDVLKSRINFEKFLQFLSFFAFYATDPNDTKYASFWYKAASYFRSLIQSEDMADGFAYLLKIFCQGQIDQKRQEKIIAFIKLLKHEYFRVDISWKLIEPVINLNIPNIPPSLLLDAVESCNETKANIDEIFSEVLPRICVSSLSIDGVEILLKFCKTLEAAKKPEKAGYLKKRLRSKVELLKKECINKNLHYQTYLYFCELEPRGIEDDEDEDEDEDYDAEEIIQRDEIKQNTEFISPPPPNVYLNPSFFIKENKVEEKSPVPHSSEKRSRDTSYMPQTAKALVLDILKMSVRPNEVLDFIRKVTDNCSSRNSSEISSTIGISLIYFFVDSCDWEMAYKVLKIYLDQGIDLSCGRIFDPAREVTISQLRRVLLLVEVCSVNEKYEDALFYVEKYRLHSDSPVLQASSPRGDSIRITLVNDLIENCKRN